MMRAWLIGKQHSKEQMKCQESTRKASLYQLLIGTRSANWLARTLTTVSTAAKLRRNLNSPVVYIAKAGSLYYDTYNQGAQLVRVPTYYDNRVHFAGKGARGEQARSEYWELVALLGIEKPSWA
jgi:hypothetical protein